MNANALAGLVDENGIEALLGGTPTALPVLSEALNRALSESVAVVRVDKVGLETEHGQLWALIGNDVIHLVRTGAAAGAGGPAATLPNLAALVAEIERLAPKAWMPAAAYARAVLCLRDAEDVYDQLSGSSSYTASEFLVSDGLTQEDAEVAFDAMRDAATAARISFLAMHNDDLVLTYGIWIGQDGEDVWMASVAPPKSVEFTLETVMQGALQRRLEEGCASLGLNR